MALFEQTRFRFYYADYTLLKIYSIVTKICIPLQFLKGITFDCNSPRDESNSSLTW